MPRILGTSLLTNEVGFPTSYKLDSIVLTNHNGDSVDIQAMVTDFSIVESIYMPSLLLSVNIKDSVNFLEEYQLSGQETVHVQLSKRRFDDNDISKINRIFEISEYPLYGKFPNHLQAYTLKGISAFAYLSKFKKISRAFTGDVKDFIYEVLTNDLGYSADQVYISDLDALRASFIVPNLSPIDAIYWALRRSFDQTGSPWYCYETLDSGIRVEPQSEMVRQSIHRTYKDGKNFLSEPYTTLDYKQREERILSIASDLKMSKYIAGAAGAYASTSEYIDISTKSRSKKKFNYNNEYNQMKWLNPNKNNLNPDFGFEEKSLASFDQASINYIPINNYAYTGVQNYHSGTQNGQINRAQSYIDNLDNITHDLRIAGDFGINAGKVVELELSKSIDPAVTVVNSKSGASDYSSKLDETLSGRHLVTSVSHNFSEEYFCEMKVKKDSVSVTYYD